MNALIRASELYRCLDDVQIFEVGAKTADTEQANHALASYQAGHIPHAHYVDLMQFFCNRRTALEYQYPNREEMLLSLQHFQVDSDRKIIIYDRDNHIWATRLWWVLYAFGFRNLAVLNGGLQAWQQHGYALESTSPIRLQDAVWSYRLTDPSPYFATLNDVLDILQGRQSAQLLNVLRSAVFTGEERRYTRAGHIPKSINVPFAHFLDIDGYFKPDISNFQSEFGLDFQQNIVIYCGSGITASGAAFALMHSQAQHIKIYDGSMAEWSAHEDLPLHITI